MIEVNNYTRRLRNKSLRELCDIADEKASEYTRKKYSDHSGFVKCWTCTSYKHWKQQTCGHYMARRHNATRWEELNLMPQCQQCNGPGQGEFGKFGTKLDEKFGNGTSEGLIMAAHANFKLDKEFVIEKILYFVKQLDYDTN
jgi:hypothetical protein